jgi:N utilization substance protein A
MEVPEIFKGVVEVKAVSREAGFRSKVAVWSTQEGVDPVGACVGLRGIRIQNIVNELNGERIDIILWDPEPGRFVAHALSPAQVVHVETDEETNTAMVVVPDRQLTLAIGKEGQNARLAAKLSGWRIDIKSQSAYEEVMDELPDPSDPLSTMAPAQPAAVEEVPAPAEPVAEPAAAEEDAPVVEEEAPAPAPAPVPVAAEKAAATQSGPTIRFAEEILVPDREKQEAPPDTSKGKGRPKGKTKGKRSTPQEGPPTKVSRPARERVVVLEDEDEYLDDDEV